MNELARTFGHTSSSFFADRTFSSHECEWAKAMPQFTPQIIRDMRTALEDVMAKVPVEYSTIAVKVYLAECILKAGAQGHTSYNELVGAAADQIQAAISLFT